MKSNPLALNLKKFSPATLKKVKWSLWYKTGFKNNQDSIIIPF